jgi:hypothetical protein
MTNSQAAAAEARIAALLDLVDRTAWAQREPHDPAMLYDIRRELARVALGLPAPKPAATAPR